LSRSAALDVEFHTFRRWSTFQVDGTTWLLNLKMQLHWSYLYFNSTSTLITQRKCPKTHIWQVPLRHPMNSSPQQPAQYEPSSWHNMPRISLYDVLQVSQLSIHTSIHSIISIQKPKFWLPHLRFFPRCRISSLVSNATLSMLAVQPSSFVYHMVVEYPQTPSIVPELLHLVLSCVESSHEQLYKRSSMEHGNGMVPVTSTQHRRGDYASRIVTTTFTEVSMKLEFISKEFSRNVEVLTTDYDNMLTV